jgi:hypothetical protein
MHLMRQMLPAGACSILCQQQQQPTDGGNLHGLLWLTGQLWPLATAAAAVAEVIRESPPITQRPWNDVALLASAAAAEYWCCSTSWCVDHWCSRI